MALASDHLRQCLGLESSVVVVVGKSVSPSSTCPSWADALALFIHRLELSFVPGLPLSPVTPVAVGWRFLDPPPLRVAWCSIALSLPSLVWFQKYFYPCYSIYCFWGACEVRSISFILQIRDLRIGVLRKLAQSHKAGRWWRHNSNLNSVFFRLNYREGGQFLSLPLLFFHVLFWSPPAHTLPEAGGGSN